MLQYKHLLPILLYAAHTVHAIGQQNCVSFNSSQQSFAVVNKGLGTPILLSEDDWPGVHRAALDFASDIQAVSGVHPTARNVTANSTMNMSSAIIVGTLGKSSLIDQVVSHSKLDVSSLQGSWEAFITQEVANPLPGIQSAYVIIGADKRGTIYALYDHSEQFGKQCSIIT
jgi:hypothetical protein